MTSLTRRTVLGAMLALPAIHTARANPLTIRFGWSSMPSHLVPAIFKVTPALRHYNKSYAVEPQRFSASTPMITAMAANQVDISVFAPTALALAVINAKLDMKIVGDNLQDGKPGYRSQSLYVKAASPIKTVTDLRGKRIGVNGIGSASYTSIVAMLRKHNMNEKTDATFIEVSFANQLPMIEDDKIDATTIPPPLCDQLVAEGKYRMLFSSADAMGPTQYNFFALRSDYLKQNRAVLVDMLEDYMRALHWMYAPANRDQAMKIVADEARLPIERMSHLLTKADWYRDPDLVPNVPGIQVTIDTVHGLGFLPRKVEVAPMVDLSLVEEAKKRVAANP